MPEPRYASLVSTGIYLPEVEVSNDLLRQRFPEPADFIDKMEALTPVPSPAPPKHTLPGRGGRGVRVSFSSYGLKLFSPIHHSFL